MTVYALAQFVIHDRSRYDRYVRRFARSLADFDGQLLAADEQPTVIEGTSDLDKVVLIAFADRNEFERWASSPTYQEIAKDRIAATTGISILITGIDEQSVGPEDPSTDPAAP